MIVRWPIILIFSIVAAFVGIAGGYIYPNPDYRPQTIDLNQVDPLDLIRQSGWKFAIVTAVNGARAYDGNELVSVADQISAGKYEYGQLLVLVDQNVDGAGNLVYKTEQGVWLASGGLDIFPELQEAVNAAIELRVDAITPLRATATAVAAGGS